jgi:ubiquinone/menaquinone biosynthesis C-methylase UbiE
MRRLADAPELLDGELADPASLDGNLRDLRLVNRRFGGTALSIRALRALVRATRDGGGTPGAEALSVLDVGTGAADIPLVLVRAPGPWQSIRVTAVDSRPEVIAAARRVSPELDRNGAVELAIADGRSLPYADGEFDVAHASMVLHHLEPPEAVRFLRELGRVARLGVVLNDLARGLVPWLGAWLLLHALTRNRYTRHDGPLSVRRAYTAAEARALLQDAGLRPSAEVHALAGHRWAIAAVRR